jgi:voltage-gated potassium channel Kch
MRRKLAVLIGLAVGLLSSGVLVFHSGLELSWLDALYFTVTTMTTVGYGDIALKDARDGVKLFGVFFMLASAGLLAATFGILTDYLIKARLEQLFGPWRSHMRNHVVLCGLGHVGIRILEQLRRLGEEVVVVDRGDDTRFLDEARALNVPVISGDMRQPSIMERANVKEARSIIAATGDDLVNLEVALNARAIRPDIRVVLRMFDANLASKVRTGFGIRTTFSTSALAAPAFALAAVDPEVVGNFYVGEDLMLILQLVVAGGSGLDGLAVGKLEELGGLSVLCHESPAGQRRLHPPDALRLAAGDKVTLSASAEVCARVKAMNAVAG